MDKINNQEVKDLVEIEKDINSAIEEYQDAKRRLCLLLAHIKINKLYEQIELHSFKDYVTSKRLNISYNTALEYAKIGEILTKYEDQFTNINFREDDGFKKLLFLEQALSHHKSDEVFKRVKGDSFKEFAKYSKPARAGFPPELVNKSKEQALKPLPLEGKWIFEENGKLFMDSNEGGTELLTFNKRFLEDEKLSKEYKAFMANIILTAMDYFKDKQKKGEFNK